MFRFLFSALFLLSVSNCLCMKKVSLLAQVKRLRHGNTKITWSEEDQLKKQTIGRGPMEAKMLRTKYRVSKKKYCGEICTFFDNIFPDTDQYFVETNTETAKELCEEMIEHINKHPEPDSLVPAGYSTQYKQRTKKKKRVTLQRKVIGQGVFFLESYPDTLAFVKQHFASFAIMLRTLEMGRKDDFFNLIFFEDALIKNSFIPNHPPTKDFFGTIILKTKRKWSPLQTTKISLRVEHEKQKRKRNKK